MVSRLAILLLLLCQACSAQVAPVTEKSQSFTVCGSDELFGYTPERNEVKSHRQFKVPVITHPYATKRDDWGFELLVKVDEKGNPVCYVSKDRFGRKETMDQERKDVISAIPLWRYTPFVVDGKPSVAIINEFVREQEAPENHVPLPEVSMDQVRIRLERTGCFGTCPSYSVDIHGDGNVIYAGSRFVDVVGKHSYQVPVDKVANLVKSLKEKDLWSLRSSYVGGVTDNPTYMLTLEMAGEKHEITDYVGGMVGMPEVVSEFEEEVDRVAESKSWIDLTIPAVDRLMAEGFRFGSKEGADLLGRAISNSDGHDDAAIIKLMSLGALQSPSARVPSSFGREGDTLIGAALGNRRQQVVERLIEAGALQTNGRIDQGKLDTAFRAAIGAGTLQGVETIWNAGGDTHPSLTFDDKPEDGEGKRQQSSVLLLLSHRYGQDPWEGRAIAEWLVAKGCDLKARAADGDTLLHRATDAGDLQFVRYLLANGLDPSALGTYGLPALGSAENEDVALALLQAGSGWMMDDKGQGFLRYANDQHWGRVLAWIRAHGGKTP